MVGSEFGQASSILCFFLWIVPWFLYFGVESISVSPFPASISLLAVAVTNRIIAASPKYTVSFAYYNRHYPFGTFSWMDHTSASIPLPGATLVAGMHYTHHDRLRSLVTRVDTISVHTYRSRQSACCIPQDFHVA